MTNQDIFEIRLAENRQRRRLENLREQLYFQSAIDMNMSIETDLLEAEQELQRLEEEGFRAKPSDEEGVLMKVQSQQGSSLMGARTTGIEATVLLRQSPVPTGCIHLLDPKKNPLVTFRIQYLGDEYTRVRVTSFVEDYSAKSITTRELDEENPACEIHHLPTFFPERLRSIVEITRATLHIQIDDLDKTIEQENTFPIWLLARTSAYLWIIDPAQHKRIDLTQFLAAWVTPNAPEIMHLLRRAADLHPDGRIVGYQVNPQGVETQVKAIFEALKEQGIRYINSTLCFGAGQGDMMQRIRLPRESLDTKSANCIDGTVLIASILEAATLSPAIVLIPGHAFLAWERAENTSDWDYLETTMIGSHSFEDAQKAGQIQVNRRTPKLLPLFELRYKYGITPME
jgi:hypothetical protein